MATSSITLPTGEKFPIFYVCGKSSDAAHYFNGKRMGASVDLIEPLYHSKIFLLTSMLVDQINASKIEFDAIICPPSSDNDVQPYRDAIFKKWTVEDLSDTLTRRGKFKARDAATSVCHLVNLEFVHTPRNIEHSIKSILIVDESIATGKSVAAIIELLRRAGMPCNARIHIAVCVYMK